MPWCAWSNIAQNNYTHNADNAGPTNNFGQKNNLKFCLDLSGPTLHKKISYLCSVGPWLKDNLYEEDNL